MALLFDALCNKERAQDLLEAVTRKRPDNSPAYWQLGCLFRETKQWAKAVAAFTQCIRVEEAWIKVCLILSLILSVCPQLFALN